jgi:hypothetical protein
MISHEKTHLHPHNCILGTGKKFHHIFLTYTLIYSQDWDWNKLSFITALNNRYIPRPLFVNHVCPHFVPIYRQNQNLQGDYMNSPNSIHLENNLCPHLKFNFYREDSQQ